MTRVSGLGNNYPIEFNASSVYQYAGDFTWLKASPHIQVRIRPPQISGAALGSAAAVPSTRPQNFTGGPNPNAAVADSGSGVADLLLGAASVTSGYAPPTSSHHYYIGFYAQDTWRVTRKLTLTYGLRMGYETGDVEDAEPVELSRPQIAFADRSRFRGFPTWWAAWESPG